MQKVRSGLTINVILELWSPLYAESRIATVALDAY